MISKKVFLDTAYAIALAVAADAHHERAAELAELLESEQTQLITTRAVWLEIGNALSKRRYRAAAVELLSALTQDPQVEIITPTQAVFQQAFELFRDRPDKEWGLVDCLSFVVMQERGLAEALTTDEHFEQAGFRALLR